MCVCVCECEREREFKTLLTLWYVLLFHKIGCSNMHIIMPSFGGLEGGVAF